MNQELPLANIITLGVSDVAGERDFYRRLGWPLVLDTDDFVVFELRGALLALFGVDDLGRDAQAMPERGRGGIRHYLTEIIPAGPGAAKAAEKARTRLLSQVDEQRNPRTKATVNQLLDRYLEVVELERTTREGYVGKIEKHIRPALGHLLVAKVDPELLERFYFAPPTVPGSLPRPPLPPAPH